MLAQLPGTRTRRCLLLVDRCVVKGAFAGIHPGINLRVSIRRSPYLRGRDNKEVLGLVAFNANEERCRGVGETEVQGGSRCLSKCNGGLQVLYIR